MHVATISTKGWVVIPAEYRRKYRIRPGSSVSVVDYGGGLSLIPLMADPIPAAQGLLKGGKSLTAALLRERRRERRHETRG